MASPHRPRSPSPRRFDVAPNAPVKSDKWVPIQPVDDEFYLLPPHMPVASVNLFGGRTDFPPNVKLEYSLSPSSSSSASVSNSIQCVDLCDDTESESDSEWVPPVPGQQVLLSSGCTVIKLFHPKLSTRKFRLLSMPESELQPIRLEFIEMVADDDKDYCHVRLRGVFDKNHKATYLVETRDVHVSRKNDWYCPQCDERMTQPSSTVSVVGERKLRWHLPHCKKPRTQEVIMSPWINVALMMKAFTAVAQEDKWDVLMRAKLPTKTFESLMQRCVYMTLDQLKALDELKAPVDPVDDSSSTSSSASSSSSRSSSALIPCDPVECAICQEMSVDVARLDSCGHEFCEQCIGTWLNIGNNCPKCRSQPELIMPVNGKPKLVQPAMRDLLGDSDAQDTEAEDDSDFEPSQ